MSRAAGTRCGGPWTANVNDEHLQWYDEWVEPGQLRRQPKQDSIALVIGPMDDQDRHQHDRTVRWLLLMDDRLIAKSLQEIGDWWLVHPTPFEV